MYTYSIKKCTIAKKLGAHAVATVGVAGAAQSATSVPVAALSAAIPSGTVLYFSATKIATLTADAAAGATSLTVSALPVALVSGDVAYAGYGPRVVVNAVQMMSGVVRVRSAEGYGDDELKVVASRKIAGAGQCRMLGLTQAALALVLGETLVTTGSGDTEVVNLGVDTGRMPHFGVIGQAEADGDGDEGDELVFLPDVVAVSDITVGTFEDGALQTVEFSYTAVKSGIFKIVNVIERNATGDYLLPPAGILAA